MKNILVIDGNSIINRAFYGVHSALSTKAGKPTNAIYGMINIIERQLKLIKPDYAAVAFDLKIPTFRHKMYDGYKAGRKPTPPDLLAQFDDAKECLSLMGLHVLELPGFEADDIQGTVAHFAHTVPDTHAYVLSGDRDLLQLIDDKITVLLASTGDTLPMDEEAFRLKYGIPPCDFVDMKAIMGDTSDNIPGVKGIGEKGAAALIGDFHTLEAVYANIDDARITKSVREKLIASKENAFLSRVLARIETHAPLSQTLEDLAYHGFDRAGLYRKFTELELTSFITKFGLSAKDLQATPAEEATALPEAVDLTTEDLTETDTVPALGATVAVALTGNALRFSDGTVSGISPLDAEGWKQFFKEEHSIVCFEGKKLLHKLADAGIEVSERIKLLDLDVYAYLLNPGSGSVKLSSLSVMFLSEMADDEKPSPAQMLRLERAMREKIVANGTDRVLDEIEIPLISVLFRMEREGLMLDVPGMREFGEYLGARADDLTGQIYLQAGCQFNLNSPKQLGEILFVSLGIPYTGKKMKSGFSTDAETLESLKHFYPIVADILEYRQVTKLRSTYANALTELADENGRVHTDFKQTLTATGRLSSADPNLQNIPIRTEMGSRMRRYFVAKEGCVLVDADYSQIELRLLAAMSGDEAMIHAFVSGEDIHRKTAAAVLGINEEFVTEEQRKRAKAINFGIVYGISAFSLSKDIGTSVGEAKRYIESYKNSYPLIDVYLEKTIADAKENGYCQTLFGRRRYIPELNSSNHALKEFGKRVAMNAPIQGTAADIMKLAMIRVANRLSAEGLEAKLVMQVHDELLIETPLAEEERVKTLLREEMENAVSLAVPLTVDVTAGKNWLDQY